MKTKGLVALRSYDELRLVRDRDIVLEALHTHDEHLVRDLVWSRIELWRELAASAGTAAERKRAAKLLRRIGSALVPERRGKGKKKAADPEQVCIVYYKTLYRLRRAIDFLDRQPRGISIRDASHCAFKECGLGLPAVQAWLDDDGALRLSVRRSPELAVRELTAHRFGIEPDTVSNKLSQMRPRSRK